MSNNENPIIEVRYSDQFLRDLKKLAKHYRHIKSDIQPIIEQLEAGETLGDQIQGTVSRVYKLRIRNSDVPKGKSGGYRMIYYFQLDNLIFLLAIYSKSELEDFRLKKLKVLSPSLRQKIKRIKPQKEVANPTLPLFPSLSIVPRQTIKRTLLTHFKPSEGLI